MLAWHYLLSWIRKTKSVLLGFCFRADLSGERLNQQRAWQGQQSFPQLLSSAEFAFCASGTAGCAEQETQLCSLGYHTQGWSFSQGGFWQGKNLQSFSALGAALKPSGWSEVCVKLCCSWSPNSGMGHGKALFNEICSAVGSEGVLSFEWKI